MKQKFFVTAVLFLGSLGAVVSAAAQDDVDTASIPGLESSVEVLRDHWGVAHIYARTEQDLFFAQGYEAARDRLFQFELWRRQATGTIAEILGRKALDHDIGARLLQFRGDMQEEMAHYHPNGEAIISAFVGGVNAYIAHVLDQPDLLPAEFGMLGIEPGFWTPEIVVSRHNGLYRNARPEVEIARMVHAMGQQQTRDLLDLEPGVPSLEHDPAIDLSLIKSEILRYYNASRAPLPFAPEDVAAEYRRVETGESFRTPPASDSHLDFISHGSNNWAVAGSRTLSGHPIMANDPHRNVSIPALRHWVHLVGPGWNVIGGGEPALPGVAIGHNEHGAWGLTIFAVDQEDLYVYDLDPGDLSRYRYDGGWEEMQILTDTFSVRGEAPVVVDLKFTRHGPVLHTDAETGKAYALRAAWLEKGAAPYLPSLRMGQAKSWEEFQEASMYLRTPAENMVWAGADGSIGWQATGITPVRRGWNGMLPVPGDGRYEWEEFLSPDRLPHIENPPEGWVATANQHLLPPGYPATIGYQWDDAFRFARVAEVLDSGRGFTMMDMMKLQLDELAVPARSLVPLLAHVSISHDAVREAADRLLAWDFVVSQNSEAAAIYVFWENELRESLWNLLVPEHGKSAFLPAHFSTRRIIDWLTVPDGRFGPAPLSGRDSVLVHALTIATRSLSERLGPKQADWQYGRVKHVQLRHPLSSAVNSQTRALIDTEALPRGGYRYTVNRAAWTSSNDRLNQDGGAAFRIIVNTGDWDQTLGAGSPGQSGDPESPHYRDLFGPWAEGEYFPVFFTRPRIESVTRSRTMLLPANRLSDQ